MFQGVTGVRDPANTSFGTHPWGGSYVSRKPLLSSSPFGRNAGSFDAAVLCRGRPPGNPQKPACCGKRGGCNIRDSGHRVGVGYRFSHPGSHDHRNAKRDPVRSCHAPGAHGHHRIERRQSGESDLPTPRDSSGLDQRPSEQAGETGFRAGPPGQTTSRLFSNRSHTHARRGCVLAKTWSQGRKSAHGLASAGWSDR